MTSKIFSQIRKDIEKYDKLRDEVIQQSRVLLKASKLLIYSLHRDTEITKNYNSVIKEKKKLDIIAKKHPHLIYEGSHSDGVQEYAEALTYYYYKKEKRLIANTEIGINGTDYLLGLSDLTGELGRNAVMEAIKNNVSQVEDIYKFTENIYHEFLKFSFRNGNLRKKSDSIKWNLKKIEEVLYDLKLKNGRSN